MANNNNKNIHQSWLTKQRTQLGDDWVETIKLEVIQKNKFTLVQDIAYGNIDLNNPLEISDFANPKVFNVLRDYVNNRVFVLQDIYNALLIMTQTRQDAVTCYTNEVFNSYMCCFQAYQILKNGLDAFSYTGSVYNIISLCNDIVKFRPYININNLCSNI